MRADVLVVPARAEQVAQQPVRPGAAADDPSDHLCRLTFRRAAIAIVELLDLLPDLEDDALDHMPDLAGGAALVFLEAVGSAE